MKNLYALLTIVALTFVVSSCNKKGCSDPTADNYVKKVKKARDNQCKYNGEGICGENIRFCFSINGNKRASSNVAFYDGSAGQSVKRLIWTNGQSESSSTYEDIVIEIFGNTESTSYTLSNTGSNKTFKASYVYGQNAPVDATSGKLEIKKDNTSDGLIATFNFTTANGVEIKNGNIYKLK